MPLAVALGRGSDGWLEAAGDHRLDPQDLAILGYRDLDESVFPATDAFVDGGLDWDELDRCRWPALKRSTGRSPSIR